MRRSSGNEGDGNVGTKTPVNDSHRTLTDLVGAARTAFGDGLSAGEQAGLVRFEQAVARRTEQLRRTDEHREYVNHKEIPRVVETCPTNVSASPIPAGGGTPTTLGCTAGGDDVAGRVNGFAGSGFFALTSGSLNDGGAEVQDSGNYRMRASGSYALAWRAHSSAVAK